MKYILGIDIGTSGTKTIIFNQNGSIIGEDSSSYSLSEPGPLMAEENPEDWKNATIKTIKNVVKDSKISPDDILSIGLSGQMHGLVLLDENNEVLRPSIIWCDRRTENEVKEIEEKLGRDYIISTTGNVPMIGFTLAKLLWVKNNEPKIYSKIRHVLLPKDYIRFILTGNYISEYSDSSGTQFIDIRSKKYDEKILAYLGLNAEVFPKLGNSDENTGNITKKIAVLTGLSEKTIVSGGAGDQAASALGNGIAKQGDVTISMGSSGVVFAPTNSFTVDSQGRVQTFCHAIADTYALMGCTQGCGISMKWFKDTLCQDLVLRHGSQVYDFVNQEAAQSTNGSNGVIYLPYLLGERSPYLDVHAKGVFFGLSASSTRGDMARSVMEGVSFSLLDCLTIIKQYGIEPTMIKVGGGGVKSPLWRSILANTLGHDLLLNKSAETGCLGVAILGAVASGLYSNIDEAFKHMIPASEKIMHDEDATRHYSQIHKIYQNLYSHLKQDYQDLDKIKSL